MIIIIGDGIAGFALAAHLEKFGIEYLIFSKLHNNNTLLNNSYGLTIQEGDNILKFLDIEFKKEDINFLLRFIKIDKNCDVIESNFHSKGNYVVSRHILLENLIKKININNLIQYKSLSICDKYIVCDSKIYKYDLLIGADGINSDVRKYLNINNNLNDVVQNTGYKFRIYKFTDTYFKNIKNDCVEYLDPDNKIRVFIKPNGSNPTTAQIYYPHNSDFVLQNLPQFIWNNIDKQNCYESVLNTTKKFDAPIGNIILLGDSYNAMTPYNGNGANTALINAHHIANIINLNKNDLTCVSVLFYSKIYDHTWKSVDASYKAFQTQFDNVPKTNNIIYSSSWLFGDKKANFLKNEPQLSYKLHELHISELYLSGLNLKSFPIGINKLLFLKKLNLSDNIIQNIPDLLNLKDLKELYLRNNLISNLEGSNIDKLNLVILRLSYNNLSKFNLIINTLEELCLTGNKLTEFEQTCPNITKLYISKNNLTKLTNLENNKIKFLRIAFNPIKLSNFENQINKNLIKELKISTDQNDIFSKEKYLNIRYGNQITLDDRKIKISVNDYYGTLKPLYPDLMYSVLLMDINNYKKCNHTLNITNELFKYLTLYLNGLLDLSEDMLETIRCDIKINKPLFEHLCQYKKKSDKSFEDLYKLCNTLYKTNKYYFQGDNHMGLPLNEKSGRPYLYSNECLYPKCKKKFNSPDELIKHLQLENIKYYHGYHLHHEGYVGYIIKLFEENKHFGKCPMYFCKFVGDLRAHYESLGIQPFWTPESKILFASEDYIKFNISESDNCMICLTSKPNTMFECLHKCVCDECFILLENNMKCILCNIKSDYLLYLE
jgi:2-polyprenyl-6-methoxyphenol hydroxylase-like FAD-dependent oxidoreductase